MEQSFWDLGRSVGDSEQTVTKLEAAVQVLHPLCSRGSAITGYTLQGVLEQQRGLEVAVEGMRGALPGQ